MQAQQFAANVLPIVASIRASGVTTLRGIAAVLTNRGVRTAQGGGWYPTTVKNLLAKAGVPDDGGSSRACGYQDQPNALTGV